MKHYFKPMLFFCLAIHVLVQNAHASSEENQAIELDEIPHLEGVRLHFSHTKSPIIRDMGYSQISIFDTATEMFHHFPLFNIHSRSPTTSPRDKKQDKEISKGPIKFGRPLPKPHPTTYEKDYDLALDFLEPGHFLCLSFFVEHVYMGQKAVRLAMLPWQELENIALIDLSEIPKSRHGNPLSSLSLTVDWMREPKADDLRDINADFCLEERALLDLQAATSINWHYRQGIKKSPPSLKKTEIK